MEFERVRKFYLNMRGPENWRNYQRSVRRSILDLYGNVCAKCGFADERALHLDHIHGRSGTIETRYKRGSTGLYVAVLTGEKSRADFQLLCANCNWIKRLSSGNENSGSRRSGRTPTLETMIRRIQQRNAELSAEGSVPGGTDVPCLREKHQSLETESVRDVEFASAGLVDDSAKCATRDMSDDEGF